MLSTRTIRLFGVIAAAAAGLLAPSLARAQSGREVSVHINVPSSIYVGDSADLQVLISGSRNVPRPDIPESPDYEISYRGPLDRSSSTTIIVNGRISRQDTIGFAHIFSITPRHTGPISIPPFDVVCDGRAYKTNEVRINAIEPARTPD